MSNETYQYIHQLEMSCMEKTVEKINLSKEITGLKEEISILKLRIEELEENGKI